MGSLLRASGCTAFKDKLWRKPCLVVAHILLLALVWNLGVHAQSSSPAVDVCPEARWKDAMFLRGPSSPETFSNVTEWKKDQIKTYVTKTVLPQVSANIAFFALALATLLVFLLWRIIRRSCMCSCMRESCEEKRNAAEPDKVIKRWYFWAQKGVLLLLCLAAFATMCAGIAFAPKQLFVRVWAPVNRLTGYLGNTTARMDKLVNGTLSDINPILDSLTALVANDINLPVLKTNLQSISTTLDWSGADPNTLINALNALNGAMASVSSQIAALQPLLGASDLSVNLTTLQAGLPGLSDASSTCQFYSARLAALIPLFANLSATNNSNYNFNPMETRMDAVQPGPWRSALAPMLASLEVWRSLRSRNTLGSLAASLSRLRATVADVQGREAPTAATTLKAFSEAWGSSLGLLLYRLDYVQTNVAQLEPATNAAVQQLQSMYGSVSVMADLQPSPAAMAANLTAFAANMSLGPGVADLITLLNSTQTVLNYVPQAVLDTAYQSLQDLRSSLEPLAPKFNATYRAIAAYNWDPFQPAFNATKASVVAPGNIWDVSKLAKAKADNAATDTVAVQGVVASGGLGPLTTNIKAAMPVVNVELAASAARLATMPSLAPYIGVTNSIKSVYDALPTPKSKELAAIKTAVANMEDLLVSLPATVRDQTASIQKSFGSGVQQLRTKVIAKAETFQFKRAADVKTLDQNRYNATCGLLALAMICLVLLIVVAAINCPWGIACAVFLLLVLAALLLVLGAVFAAVLVAANDGCQHAEGLVLDALGNGSSVTPLIEYYFYGDNSTSVKAVLKSANLVDIDKVTADVTGSTNSMFSNITSQFPPKAKLTAIIADGRAFVTNTLEEIDSLLSLAAVSSVRPIYLDLKSYPCCEVTDVCFQLWVVFTVGGWLIYVSCTLAMGLLGQLDQLPQSGCCGCKPIMGPCLPNKTPADSGDGGLAALGPCNVHIRPVGRGGQNKGKDGDVAGGTEGAKQGGTRGRSREESGTKQERTRGRSREESVEGGAPEALAVAPDQQEMAPPQQQQRDAATAPSHKPSASAND